MRLRHVVSVVLVLAACGDADWQPWDNTALASGTHTGSAVYVGSGRMLTNWHVCYFAEFDESLTTNDHLRFYNAPEDGSTPYYEGIAPTSFYCYPPGGSPRVVVSDQDEGECQPVETKPQLIELTRIDEKPRASKIVFADWTIDLCILEIDNADGGRERLDAKLEPIALGGTVAIGEKIHVSGLKRNSGIGVGVETCTVTDTTKVIHDPDPLAPSPLAVPSFAADCAEVIHGSSGSPAFGADGRIRGLVWTGTDLREPQSTTFISDVNAWEIVANTRPAAQVTQLKALLDSSDGPR